MNEKIHNLAMYDEFELDGYWWIPGNEDNKFSGTLTYNTDGITLKILGDFADELKFYMTNKYHILHGIIEENKVVTLYDGFVKTMHIGSVMTKTLIFNQLIVGAHFNTKDDTMFSSLSVNYSLLENWIGEYPFERFEEHAGEQIEKVGVIYTFPSSFETYIHKKQTRIKSSHTLKSSTTLYKHFTFNNQATLDIIPDTSMDLEWYLDMIRELQDFLTLMTNRAIYIKQIQAESDSDSPYEVNNLKNTVYIFLSPEKKFEEKDFSRHNLHISYNKIKDNLGIILNKWFTDSSYSSRKIYLRNLYDEQIDQEARFLNYAKSMESFQRDTSGENGQFLPDNIYEPIKLAMLNSIQQGTMEKDIYSSLKSKMVNVLDYAHHFGFQRRIRDMFKGLDERIKDVIFPGNVAQIKSFANHVTLTRDYYTHYGKKPDYYFKGWELYFVNSKLHIILYYYFCERLGIEKDIIWHAINNDHTIKQRLKTKTEPTN
ncbi:HEPN domain-containing protein [Bacillus sp. JJ1127]|uniref:ApeA N-terminal domain 1-containing protein n=1 Tax=Bacillus sp. JJ1127 TaxID=3122952 RepID=UPI002FFD590E